MRSIRGSYLVFRIVAKGPATRILQPGGIGEPCPSGERPCHQNSATEEGVRVAKGPATRGAFLIFGVDAGIINLCIK